MNVYGELYDVEISVEKDGGRPISLTVFRHAPDLISVCSQDGGSMLSAAETRQLIEALQKAIEMIEAK